MAFKPYLAVDIETTGLALDKSLILQLAAVYDDGVTDIKDLPYFNVMIDNGVITYGEPFALGLNGWILKEIASYKRTYGDNDKVQALGRTQRLFDVFLNKVGISSDNKGTIAGKNAAGFDLPILKNNGFKFDDFKHRVIDVGTLYLPEFGYVPTLDEINKFNGRTAVAHDALADCYDVVAAIRAKVKSE